MRGRFVSDAWATVDDHSDAQPCGVEPCSPRHGRKKTLPYLNAPRCGCTMLGAHLNSQPYLCLLALKTRLPNLTYPWKSFKLRSFPNFSLRRLALSAHHEVLAPKRPSYLAHFGFQKVQVHAEVSIPAEGDLVRDPSQAAGTLARLGLPMDRLRQGLVQRSGGYTKHA